MRVAISGIGIGGPTLAWWLRRYGHEPILIEAAPKLRTGGYAIDFWGSGYSIAERMGLIPALEKDGYVVEKLRSITLGGRTTSTLRPKSFVEIAGGRYLTLARSDLSRRLFDACAGIESRFGVGMTAIEQRDDKVDVRLSDGTSDEFDLVIGADGLHSAVRSLVFGPTSKFEDGLGLHIAAAVLKGYRPREELTYVQYTRPGKQISRLSLRDDRTLILFVFRDSLLESEPDDETAQKQVLRRIFGGTGWETDAILNGVDDADDFYFDRVSQIHLPHWSSGRVALIGDAAACPSLLAGEGSGLAMTEAYVLAGELHKAGGDYRAAFERYEARLHDYVSGKQSGAKRLTGFFAPRSWFGLFLRELAVNLTAIPPLTRRIVGAEMANEIEVPDYEAMTSRASA